MRKKKKQKLLSFKDVINFLHLKKTMVITRFITILYIGEIIIYFLIVENIDVIVKNVNIFVILDIIISLLGSLVITITELLINPQIINSLCYKVIEKNQIKEQYQRFLEIRKCIVTHKNSEGKCDIETNIGVIEAAIEHDQAQSIVVPIFVTAITAVFFETGQISVLSIGGSFIAILIILLVVELVRQIPRNAFIKKAIEKIKEENVKK